MEKRRVVVTGLGAVTAIGIGAEAFWNSLKAGQVGIDRITQCDTEKFKVKLAAEVKDFKAADFMDVKSAVVRSGRASALCSRWSASITA